MMLDLNTDDREAFMGQLIIVNGSKIIVPPTFSAYILIAPPLSRSREPGMPLSADNLFVRREMKKW